MFNSADTRHLYVWSSSTDKPCGTDTTYHILTRWTLERTCFMRRRADSSNLCAAMLTEQLYGKHAAALYAQAADFNKTARFYYMKAQDAYYLANAQASYDDWRRARRQWDYFYRRK